MPDEMDRMSKAFSAQNERPPPPVRRSLPGLRSFSEVGGEVGTALFPLGKELTL